jgi:hypothetical protein
MKSLAYLAYTLPTSIAKAHGDRKREKVKDKGTAIIVYRSQFISNGILSFHNKYKTIFSSIH